MASFLLLDVQEHGLRDIHGRFARFSEEMQDVNRDVLRNLGRKYVDTLREEAPHDTGALREGITFKTYERGKDLELRITSHASYTAFVLGGTRPHSAPISALQGWADRHGINVWALWWSIKKRGTSMWSFYTYGDKANRFQARAEQKMQPEFETTVRAISQRLHDYMVGI